MTHDVHDGTAAETVYECLDCGERVREETHPSDCPDCGATMRNCGTPLE